MGGRLTDSRGRTVDFTNTVIILTSNLGAQFLLDYDKTSEISRDLARKSVMSAVKSHFSSEFLNRLSSVVMFNSLGADQLGKICQKSLCSVKRRLVEQGIRVVLEKSGAEAIIDNSFDPSYGARPVERYLEQTIVTKLSKMLISGELESGYTVFIEGVDDEETYEVVEPPRKRRKTLSYRVEPIP